MNIKRRHRESAEVSTESLNDIMFFLMLFFLILSTMINPNVIKINLPTAKNNQNVPTKSIVLYVTADHKYFIDKQPVELNDLESSLVNAVKDVKEPAVMLKFDNTLTVQDVVDVMQIGAKLKIKMLLGTKAPNG